MHPVATHLSQQGGKETPAQFYNSFHWRNLKAEVYKDIEFAKATIGQ
jgi:hypothetical protein